MNSLAGQGVASLSPFDRTDESYGHQRRAGARPSVRRLLLGGGLGNAGRLPRYAAIFVLSAVAIWGPITGYLKTAPLQFTSSTSLILPGSGASSSVNLDNIGQVSSFANSAFASNSISPTETYKRLIGADRILANAAGLLGISQTELGRPRIELVDQTGLIRVQVTGSTAEEAQARGDALLKAFFADLDALRADEKRAREGSGFGAMQDYQASVHQTRKAIANLQASTGLFSADQFRQQVAALDTLEIDLNAMTTALSESTHRVRSLETTLGLPARLAALTLKLFADAEYGAALADIATQAAAYGEVRSAYGARHPRVEAAQAALRAARAAARARAVRVSGLPDADLDRLDLAPEGARAELLSNLVKLEAERAGLAARLDRADRRFRAEKARLKDLTPAAARLEDLQRDFAVAEAVFASANASAQATKSDVYASYPLVQVLEDPSLPEDPSSPRRILAVAAGAAAMLMVLVGLGLGWVRGALIGRLLLRSQGDQDEAR